VKEMIASMQREISEGSTWFLIGNGWFEAWRNYVFDDVLTGQTTISDIKESELSARTAPGPINNEDILFTLPKAQYLLEVANATKWQNAVLKPDLKEGAHFIIVDEIVWDKLKARYDLKNPQQELKRQGILANEETGECIVELYLRQILIIPLSNQTLFKFDCPKTIIISRRETLTSLEKKISRVLMSRLFERQERGMVVNKMRLWKASAATKLEDLAEIEKKVKNYTHVKFDGVLLNHKSDVQKNNIYVEELPLAQADEDMVVIELPKLKDTFVLVP
jgi:hypothetical protein